MYCVVRFTSQVAADLLIAGSFEGLDEDGCSTDVHILFNGESRFTRLVTGTNVKTTFDMIQHVEVGDTVDFAVGYGENDNYFNDTTALDVQIQTIDVQVFPHDLEGFNSAAGTPPVAIDFESVAPNTDITDSTTCGISFTTSGSSAPLIVVRGKDTYTPTEGFIGCTYDAAQNKLFPTTGDNVLSPGGTFLGPGLDPSIEDDDLDLTFNEPVRAFGFDILSQSEDNLAYIKVHVYDPQNNELCVRDIQISNLGGVGAPGGHDFWGIVSSISNIKRIWIDEYDPDNWCPDSNIGYDTFRLSCTLCPPTILNSLHNQTIKTGEMAQLTVQAQGTSVLTYQWRKDGNNLSDDSRINGSTTSTLTINNFTMADSGNYDVLVTNGCGEAKSNAATLSVIPGCGPNLVSNGDFEIPADAGYPTPYIAPNTFGNYWIVSEGIIDHVGPLRQSDHAGWDPPSGRQSVDLCGSVAGTMYQDLATTAGTTYILRFAVAGNPDGPPNIKTCEVWWGSTKVDTVTFDYTGHSHESMGWEWRQYNVVSSETTTRLLFKSLDDSSYGLVIDAVSVTESAPIFDQQPISQNIVVGDSIQLTVRIQGTDGITYQWRKGGNNLSDDGRTSGSTTATLTITNVTIPDSGSYDVVVTNTCGSVTSNAASLAVVPEPVDHGLGQNEKSGFNNDPVNTASGNFTHGETDLAIAARGLPLAFRRFYNSRDVRTGSLGYAWTHTYEVALSQQSDIVEIRWEDGHVDRFKELADHSFRPLYVGMYDRLTRQADNTWELVRKDLSVYRFDSAGKLASITDRNGNSLVCAYDGNNKLASVTDGTGRQLIFTHDGDLLTRVTDYTLRTVTFNYTAGRLTQVTDVLGQMITYSYTNGYLASITDQRSVVKVRNFYDVQGRVIVQWDGKNKPSLFAYDTPNPSDTRLKDALGNVTIHTHEGFLLKKITYYDASTIEYTCDAWQNRTSIKDRNGNTVRFEYDSRGNVTKTTVPDGGVTTAVYGDSRFPDLPTRKTDCLGMVTEWTYDDHGNVLTESRAVGTPLQTLRSWIYNDWGQVLTETNEQGNITSYGYDTTAGRAGLLLSVADAEGHITWYDYDTLWRRTKVTDARGASLNGPAYTTTYTYDDGDRLIFVIGPPVGTPSTPITHGYGYDTIGNRTSVTNGLGYTTTYEYDNNSNLLFVREPLSRITEYRYDALNRKIAMIDANGHETTYGYDPMGNLRTVTRKMYGDGQDLGTTYTHDAHGNILTATDPSGRTTTYTYDAMHRKKTQVDDLSHTWRWDYDCLGRVTTATDATDNPTSYGYDALGRLQTVTVWNDQHQAEVTQYGYDLAGNLTRITDAGGRITEKEYDAIARLILQRDGLGNETHYGYDAVGNQTSILDANGRTTAMDYDAENRLIAVHYPDATQVTFTYDANGNRRSLIDANGKTYYTYDTLDRLVATMAIYGRPVPVTNTYDMVGNRTALTYPGGKVVSYTYDAADRMKTLTDWAGHTTTYQYDLAGRITGIAYPNGVVHARNYDGCGRLDAMNDKLGISTLLGFTWTRDAEGNPLSQSEEGTLPPTINLPARVDYQYDDDNRLTTSTEGTYTHDNNGNLTSRTINGTTTTFGYDAEDRLISQTTGSSVIQHTYDGGGYRVARTENGQTTRYVLDRGRSMSHVLCETDGNGTIKAYYIHGPQIVGRIGADGSQRYYHTDAIGNVVALTDETGNIADRYAYEPFGVPAGREGSTHNPFTYVGGLGVMAESDGLYFMRARFYEPSLGRFMGKDPVRGQLIRPATLHAYCYAMNNPALFTDATGEFVGAGILEAYLVISAAYEGLKLSALMITGKATPTDAVKAAISVGLPEGLLSIQWDLLADDLLNQYHDGPPNPGPPQGESSYQMAYPKVTVPQAADEPSPGCPAELSREATKLSCRYPSGTVEMSATGPPPGLGHSSWPSTSMTSLDFMNRQAKPCASNPRPAIPQTNTKSSNPGLHHPNPILNWLLDYIQSHRPSQEIAEG